VRYVLALDPLVTAGVGAKEVLIVVIKVVVAFVVMLIAVIFMVWFERKLIAGFQNRIGPNKAGRWGILQTIADGLKLVTKEYIHPEQSDRMVFLLAPYLAVVPVFVTFSIVPLGGDFSNGNNGVVSILGEKTLLQVADPPIGILLMLAMSAISVYGAMLAGWSSGSKYPLLGAVRSTAQLLSYEAAFGLAILGVLVQAQTLSTHNIAAQQAWVSWRSIGADWFWLRALVPFGIFLIAATAETNHPPFDLVEAEQELVGGFNTEYTGIRFAIFFLAEFMNVITMSAIAVTLFLGGPSGPSLGFLADGSFVNVWLMPIFWFTVKVLALLFATVWLRASLPRMRYDRLMALGWKYLIEIAILRVLVSIALLVGREEGWHWYVVAPISASIAIFGFYTLYLAMPKQGEYVEEFR
jgi:NADH-quinone oxidoreductase subunit H